MKKKIIYIDMDDTLCDYQGAIKAAKEENPGMPFPQAEYGFYVNLEPLPGAIDAVEKLYQSSLYEPWILTAPSLKNALCYTEKRVWVEAHLGMKMVERLIISPDKGLLKGDYLIDDLAAGKGQERFAGKLLQYGSTEFPNWAKVSKLFL